MEPAHDVGCSRAVVVPGGRRQVVAAPIDQLKQCDLAAGFTEGIGALVDYVLDGAGTGGYSLLSADVHPGGRAKLEYEVQRVFKRKKTKPLDVELAGVPLDLKATVGDNRAFPEEAHCRLCICTQARLKNHAHPSWLIRTHRSWLYRGKGNKDSKLGIAGDARNQRRCPVRLDPVAGQSAHSAH